MGLPPKLAPAVAPASFTSNEDSCFPVTGMKTPQLRAWVRRRGCPHDRFGKLLVIRTDVFLQVLADNAVPTNETGAPTCDSVLAELGFGRTGGSR